jgi:hypothetical protein
MPLFSGSFSCCSAASERFCSAMLERFIHRGARDDCCQIRGLYGFLRPNRPVGWLRSSPPNLWTNADHARFFADKSDKSCSETSSPSSVLEDNFLTGEPETSCHSALDLGDVFGREETLIDLQYSLDSKDQHQRAGKAKKHPPGNPAPRDFGNKTAGRLDAAANPGSSESP